MMSKGESVNSESRKRILIIDFTNYEDYPIGGYLSMARNLMSSFGNELALVGITTDKSDPIGRWFRKRIGDSLYDFFALSKYAKARTKHLVPDRLMGYLLLKFYSRPIFQVKIKNVFLQRQELLLALPGNRNMNICYCFGGVENPLAISKYKFAPYLSRWFERLFFNRLRFVNTILASGDRVAIKEMINRSYGRISEDRVIMFPTRINTDLFKPASQSEARKILGISLKSTVIVTTGRLAELKGWDFMIECFRLFEQTVPDSLFYFVGEGEDEEKIKAYLYANNLGGKVILTGSKKLSEVALYLNASDLFIMGSLKEGWSTSLLEAAACAIPVCVTNFSSARDIVEDGYNGFVVDQRDVGHFVVKMQDALDLPKPIENEKVMNFSAARLKDDLIRYWTLS